MTMHNQYFVLLYSIFHETAFLWPSLLNVYNSLIFVFVCAVKLRYYKGQ